MISWYLYVYLPGAYDFLSSSYVLVLTKYFIIIITHEYHRFVPHSCSENHNARRVIENKCIDNLNCAHLKMPCITWFERVWKHLLIYKFDVSSKGGLYIFEMFNAVYFYTIKFCEHCQIKDDNYQIDILFRNGWIYYFWSIVDWRLYFFLLLLYLSHV